MPVSKLYEKYMVNFFFFCILKVTKERSRIRSWIRILIISQRYGSADPDSHQNVTDLKHCGTLPLKRQPTMVG
jgi:hypothetical protein